MLNHFCLWQQLVTDVFLSLFWATSLLYFLLPVPLRRGVTESLWWLPGVQPRSTYHSAWCGVTIFCSHLSVSLFPEKTQWSKGIFLTWLASAEIVAIWFPLLKTMRLDQGFFCTFRDGSSLKCLEPSVIILATLCWCFLLIQSVVNYTVKGCLARV